MKKNNIIYIIILLIPLIDLLSSLSNRIIPNTISIGSVIKGLIIIVSVIYIIYFSKSKYRKISIIYLLAILAYLILYFLFKTDLLALTYLRQEINYLFKFIYFPIVLFGLLNYFDSNGFEKDKLNNIMIYSFIFYIIVIIVPTFLNINFNSYTNTNYFGSVGWFYSANEVSTILLLMFPFIYTLLDKNKYLTIILFLFGLYAISLVGTKVTLFGIIITTCLLFICGLIKTKKITINNCIMFSMCIVTILFMVNNYSTMNLKSSLTDEETKEIEKMSKELEGYYQETTFLKNFKEIGSKLLSSRDIYALNTFKIFSSNYSPGYISLGMGFTNTDRIDNIRVEKLIEIDFLDIFFHMGIFAIFLILFPFIYLLYYLLKNKSINKEERIFFIMMLLMILGISSTAGHTLIAPAVSLYIAIYFMYLFNDCSMFIKRKINNKKISILALHMGYGGVENVIANRANMLIDKYDVEIISLYKQKYSIPFKLDDRITVTYLMNDVSNRETFKLAIKNRDIIKIFKEGIKSIKILLLKEYLMMRAINDSDAKIIISTRFSFSKLLQKYKRNNVITIHEEHTYNILNSYIDELDKLDLDFIMPVCKMLEKCYKKKMGNKVIYIPLSLDFYPDKNNISILNNKNLISVGRLEKVKGYNDLLDVMSLVIKKDSKIKLIICGDGSQKSYLSDKIKKLNLENNVKLLGYQKPDKLKDLYKKSSLYVLTSYEESFGLVIIEAMSFGVPCIMFDSAKGPLECVNKNNGFIIKNRNQDKMADEIIKYFEKNNKDKKLLQNECREVSKNYEFETVKEKYLDFINCILKKK